MDGIFVPNTSFSPSTVKSCKLSTTIPLNVHLMVSNPLEIISEYADAGQIQFISILSLIQT